MGLIYALNTSLLYVFSHKWRGLSNCRQYDFARFIIGKFCVYESFSPHCNQSLLLARSLSLYLSLTCHHQNFILPYTAENFSIV